jgi:nitrogen fixation/metabolism regulation signal transduction histidine kinase
MTLPSRFALKLLAAMLLVALLSAALSAYALQHLAGRLMAFNTVESTQAGVAQNHAAELFRNYFAHQKENFRQYAHRIAQAGVTDTDLLASTPGLLRARLLSGQEVLDGWEAEPSVLAGSREAPPIVVATSAADGTPHVLELTFGIPVTMYESFLALRDAIDKHQQMARVHEAVLPRFLRQYIIGVLALLAIAPLMGWLFARGVTRRVARLSQAAQKVGAGDLTVRVGLKGKDELAELGRTFDAMVDELSQARSRLEYLQKVSAWQEVARRLAHEIKNPLTPIQLAVQELVSKYQGDDPRFRQLLDTANEILSEEITSLRRLVDNFSAFARLPKVEPLPVDLVALVTELVRMQPEWQEQVTVTSGEPSVPALCDKLLFRRVLANLVENALQAVEGAGRVPQIEITVERHARRAIVQVDDNGPGVAVSQRERIFDPYITYRSGGTGLGLAIVRKIIIDHGGDVRVGENPHGGARFTVELPSS